MSEIEVKEPRRFTVQIGETIYLKTPGLKIKTKIKYEPKKLVVLNDKEAGIPLKTDEVLLGFIIDKDSIITDEEKEK